MLDRLLYRLRTVISDVVVLERNHIHPGRLQGFYEARPPAENQAAVVVGAVVDQRRLEVDYRQVCR